MTPRLFCTWDHPPAGFVQRKAITRKDVLNGPVAFLLMEEDDLDRIFSPYMAQMTGIILVPGLRCEPLQRGPRLWQMFCNPADVNQLACFVTPMLVMLSELLDNHDQHIRLMSAKGRVQRELEITLQDYRRVTADMRHQLNELMAAKERVLVSEAALRQLNQDLEARVHLRTKELSTANEELHDTLISLRAMQDQLVQAEKLAALGSLVAGVAHEINTPVGNSMLAASTLSRRLLELQETLSKGLSRSSLENFLEDAVGATDLIQRNLNRAAELVESFKHVAVDQHGGRRREFDLARTVHEVVIMIQPTINNTPFTLHVDVAEGIVLDSYPGALSQALTNLINNAIVHAFADRPGGNIFITGREQPGDSVALTVRDDGHGIPQSSLKRIFEPFYTTRLGQGSSGLGLHITYNAVCRLGGRIDVQSSPDQGTEFMLIFPRSAPT